MAVSRQNAYVGEQIILKMGFSSNTGAPVIPSEVSRVEIQTMTGTVLETITSVTSDGSGNYTVTTSSSWNTTPRLVRDVWYYKATIGGIERQAIGQTNIVLVSPVSPDQLISASDLRMIPLGTDISGYSDEQLNFWAEIAQTMIEDYTGRKFGLGSFTEKGETTVDQRGRIVITTRAVPVDVVDSVTVWVPGSQKIDLSVQYMDVYKDKGYMYYNTQSSIGWAMNSAYPSVVLTKADKLSYEITYTTASALPMVVKQALAIVVGNLAKNNKIMQETGVSGITGSLAGFKSGDYSVNFGKDTSRNGYKPQGRGTDSIITPDVMEILQRYKFIRQNSY